MSSEYNSIIVVGEDLDLLIALFSSKNIYFRKSGKGKITEKLYSTHSFKFGKISAKNILFLHAFSGCDTSVFSILEKSSSSPLSMRIRSYTALRNSSRKPM